MRLDGMVFMPSTTISISLSSPPGPLFFHATTPARSSSPARYRPSLAPSHHRTLNISKTEAHPFQQELKMLSTMIALPLAVMAALAGTATASPITAGSNNLTPARAAFTYYTPNLGACGSINTEAELVVALSYVDFDPYTPNGNANNNSLCGKKLRASYNGKSVDVAVVDRCAGCASGSLDLSTAAFRKWSSRWALWLCGD